MEELNFLQKRLKMPERGQKKTEKDENALNKEKTGKCFTIFGKKTFLSATIAFMKDLKYDLHQRKSTSLT